MVPDRPTRQHPRHRQHSGKVIDHIKVRLLRQPHLPSPSRRTATASSSRGPGVRLRHGPLLLPCSLVRPDDRPVHRCEPQRRVGQQSERLLLVGNSPTNAIDPNGVGDAMCPSLPRGWVQSLLTGGARAPVRNPGWLTPLGPYPSTGNFWPTTIAIGGTGNAYWAIGGGYSGQIALSFPRWNPYYWRIGIIRSLSGGSYGSYGFGGGLALTLSNATSPEQLAGNSLLVGGGVNAGLFAGSVDVSNLNPLDALEIADGTHPIAVTSSLTAGLSLPGPL